MIDYVGIATVRGPAGFQLPVYAAAYGQGDTLGSLVAGGYVPHFRATDDVSWLEVTLHDGATGWLQNDPANVTDVQPDPNITTVCIDPGHGGAENGAIYFDLVEKDINFDISYTKLSPKLYADGRIGRIWYTRNGDYDVSLQYRWDLANASGANLFLSVHSNSSPDPNIRGTETYFKCGSEATADLRARSQRAACLVQRGIISQFTQWGSITCPPLDRGLICRLLSEAEPVSYYYVLENTYVPAVLTEIAYLSNRGEAYCLANNVFRDFIAQGLYEGITAFLFTEQNGTGCEVTTLTAL